MAKIYSIIIAVLICVGVTSCHTKLTPVEQLQVMADDMKANSSSYSEEEWETKAQEFQQLEEKVEANKGEYTDEELKEIGRQKGICLAYFTKHAAKGFKESMEDAMHEATGLIEGFTEGLKE